MPGRDGDPSVPPSPRREREKRGRPPRPAPIREGPDPGVPRGPPAERAAFPFRVVAAPVPADAAPRGPPGESLPSEDGPPKPDP